MTTGGEGLLRIELATSEIDGGNCVAWADPAQVLGLVALSQPDDTFLQVVEPRLRQLGACEDAVSDDEAGTLPRAVRTLAARLQTVHRQLYEENQDLRREPRRVEVSCILSEDDRVYLVKSGTAWICLLRDGRAFAAEANAPRVEGLRPALGGPENLKCEVTSVPIQPGDTFILLTAANDVPVDTGALTNLFAQTPDLKRACDGLVNLMGLQSQGASAVALRFIPIGCDSRPDAKENPLLGLAHEFFPTDRPVESVDAVLDRMFSGPSPQDTVPWEASDEKPAAPPSPAAWDEPAVDHLLSSIGDPRREHPAAPAEPSVAERPLAAAKPPVTEHPPAPVKPPATEHPPALVRPPVMEHPPEPVKPPVKEHPPTGARPAVEEPSTMEQAPSAEEPSAQPRIPDYNVAAAPDEREHGLFEENSILASGKRHLRAVSAALAIVGMLMVLVLALPRMGSMRSLFDRNSSPDPAGGLGTGPGVILVAPDPPARAVLLDGDPVGEDTPVRLEGVSKGTHRIGLDLGPCGIWETDVEVRGKGEARVSPRLTGSVEITAADASAGGKVWTEGRGKLPIPATLDSLPVGWNRIFYEDERLPLWDRQVLIRAGKTARITVPNNFSSSQGLVKVESMSWVEREGMTDSEGDTVLIDGRPCGRTPLETSLPPGLHSIRVTGEDGGSFSQVLEMRPGSARHVAALLGRGPKPEFHHIAPGKVLLSGPLLLSVEITGMELGAASSPTLHLPELAPGSREIPMNLLDPEKGVLVGAVDPVNLPYGRPVAYYFTVVDNQGETVSSDLYRCTPQRRWTRRAAPAEAPESAPTEEAPAVIETP